MCLSVPAQVLEIDGLTASVDAGGNRIQANVSLLEEVAVGDYVLVHAGFAIQKYDQQEAEEVLQLLREAFAPETPRGAAEDP